MNFVSVRHITDQPKELVAFYAAATGLDATWHTGDFAEVKTPSATLAIASSRTLALFGGEIARAAANHSAILEFRVADVDETFGRLDREMADIVQEPTTMPWDNRSLTVRDPDGNLVKFFAPVTAEAIRKSDS